MSKRWSKQSLLTAVAALSATMAFGGAAAIASAHAVPHRAMSHSAFFEETVSHQSFDATVAALKHAVASNGMMILGTLNQAGALSTTGLELKGAESFFVGNPVVGKKMFQMDPAVGAVIPLRVYVWVAQDGHTMLGYFRPSYLMSLVNPKMGKSAAMMNQTFAKLVAQATK